MKILFIGDVVGKVGQQMVRDYLPRLRQMHKPQVVILNGENVTPFLRTEEVGNMASASSVNKDVRLKLVELQRALAARENVVMDGRDIGTYFRANIDESFDMIDFIKHIHD